MNPPLLSKTSFMHFLECPIWLWLERVRPELLPPVDPGTQRIFDQGHLIDDFARGLFPGGFEVQGYNTRGFENTVAAIAKGEKILYQPTAVADGIAARADILVKGRGGRWDLYEVKSSTSVSSEYLSDVAFQRTCFERAGIIIGNTFLVHVNNQYVRKGEVAVDQLLHVEDITDDVVREMPEVARLIPDAKKVLSWPAELEPTHLAQCPDLRKCEYVGYWLNSLKPKSREAVLRTISPAVAAKMLENDKVDVDMEGLSTKYIASIPYHTPEQLWPPHIDKDEIRKEISALGYPIHFLDYETYNPAIPPFDGYRPYQQMPFQFSVYVIDGPDAKPRIFDFLMGTFEDPATQLIEALREAIGPKGSVISWYATFEMGRNEELAASHPKDAKFLRGINDRTYDIYKVFKRRLYVDPRFRGSSSIKDVMPVLIPDLSYKKLNIQEGGAASASWPVLTDPKLPEEKREQLRKDMIEYCRLDVLSMVRILDYLRNAVEL